MINRTMYNQHVLSLLTLLVAVVIATGCGKKEASAPEDDLEIEPVAKEASAIISKPVATDVNEAVTSEADAESESEVLPAPYRVGAIIDRGGDNVTAGLVNKLTGIQKMVVVGDTFENFAVQEIDSYVGVVFLEKDGQRYVAKMEDGPEIDSMPAPSMSSRPEMNADFAMQGAEQFTPTESEIARGIDPNDASTWPADYRGPAIERASTSPVTYEPTPAEMSRGIDPNDPKTWPADYRGPGIERAAIEIEKFVPTDDELSRGIDPNDAKTWPTGYRGPGIERAMMKQNQSK